MSSYSEERKAFVLSKMLPPHNLSVSSVAEQEGISLATLYAWRKKAKMEGQAVPGSVKTTQEWSAQARLAVVIETANLSEIELSEYCRRKGIYVEDVHDWHQAALDGQVQERESRQVERQRQRKDLKYVKSLEKEIVRKDKALAEAAALLVLSKKAEAIWGNNEAD
jgi:transposase-like protein